MPSAEMLKKLLDDFIEKEQLVTEELKVVSEQIVELEARLEKCRARLGTIGNDRNRVLEIQQRYAGGPFYQRQVGGNVPTQQAPVQPTPAAGVGQAVSMAVAAAMNKDVKTSLVADLPRNEPVKAVEPAPAKPSPAPPAPVATPEPPKPVAPPEPAKPVAPPEPPKPVAPPEPEPQPYVPPPQTLPVAEPDLVDDEPPAAVRSTLSGIGAILNTRRDASLGGGGLDALLSAQEPTIPIMPPAQQEDVPQPQPQPQQQQQPQQAVEVESKPEEDDAVKSINDALRSLFR